VFSIQNSKTLQHASPRNKPAKILLVFYINFQRLENKRKKQSDSKRRQWLTASFTGPSRTKFMAALKATWDWSFHTSVPLWLSKSGQIVWSSFDDEKNIFVWFNRKRLDIVMFRRNCFSNTSDAWLALNNLLYNSNLMCFFLKEIVVCSYNILFDFLLICTIFVRQHYVGL